MGQSSPGVLSRVGATAVFAAIPAMGLVWFAPVASNALALNRPTGPGDVAAVAEQFADADSELAVPAEWQETSLATDLVAIARKQSRDLNTSLRSLRSQLAKQKAGSFSYSITLQRLLLVAAQRDTWDTNWRRIGRPGVDLNLIQNNLVGLQDKFVASNTDLQTLQAKEVATGSISSYTPPNF